VLEHSLDLAASDAAGGQLRKRAQREELDRVRLIADLRFTPGELAQKQQLVDVIHRGRVRVALAVKEGGELHCPGTEAALLVDLTYDRLGGRVVDVHPTSG
jgi:hypothetical protein